MGLMINDSVMFKLSVAATPEVVLAKGKIKYIGKKATHRGIVFGIEIEVHTLYMYSTGGSASCLGAGHPQTECCML